MNRGTGEAGPLVGDFVAVQKSRTGSATGCGIRDEAAAERVPSGGCGIGTLKDTCSWGDGDGIRYC